MCNNEHSSTLTPGRCLWPRVQAGLRPTDSGASEAHTQLRPAAQHWRDGVSQDIRGALLVESSSHPGALPTLPAPPTTGAPPATGAAQGNLETVNVHKDWTIRLFFYLFVCCFLLCFFEEHLTADTWLISSSGADPVEGTVGFWGEKHKETALRKRIGDGFKKKNLQKKQKHIYSNV